MNRRIFALILGLGAAVLMAPTLAVAEDHLAEAISHTKEAIDHGKQGHADVLVTHAEAALKHAKAAEQAKDNPHTKQGITHLNAAIDHGKQGHDITTCHQAATKQELKKDGKNGSKQSDRPYQPNLSHLY